LSEKHKNTEIFLMLEKLQFKVG